MASTHKFAALAIVAILLPAVAMATEYIVGDDKAWNVGVNYAQWAAGKVFHVGDTLVFKYGPPHNVFKVDGTQFKDCQKSENQYTTGNDTIPLNQPGKKWYICGFADHCTKGQKLAINVESDGPTAAPGPSPPSNNSYRSMSSLYHQILVAAVVVMAIIAV